MKRANLIACAVLSILLINPVTTWAGSCPEGQKWHSAWQECVKDRPSLGKKKKSITNKNPAEVETWKFGGAKRFATTTGGIEDSIMGHGDEVKFVVQTSSGHGGGGDFVGKGVITNIDVDPNKMRHIELTIDWGNGYYNQVINF